MSFLSRHGLARVLNAIGTPTIVGANVAAPEVIDAMSEILRVNVEIDALQRAASRAIARATGAEAGCVTSSASSGLAIASAAAMTGADLARIVQLPDTRGMRNEVVMLLGHDVNFGGRVSQMVRIAGARVVRIGTANHCDAFHLRGAVTERTAAVLYVVNGAVHPEAHYLSLEQTVEIAAGVPVIVDAAAEPDVRPFLRAGAGVVIASGHKAMGAPTSGLMCGRKDLIRACYLQNWGLGRAMKVGKEGIAGLIVALERWQARDAQSEVARFARLAEIFARRLAVHDTPSPHRIEIETGAPARHLANVLREGDPPVWVNAAHGTRLTLDLRVMDESDADAIAARIAEEAAHPRLPADDAAYHDLYWSETRLLKWPD
ncbi:MAG: aminotransferase class V-fold PLP-dependent enzyme [Bryobacteraceae bacterium]